MYGKSEGVFGCHRNWPWPWTAPVVNSLAHQGEYDSVPKANMTGRLLQGLGVVPKMHIKVNQQILKLLVSYKVISSQILIEVLVKGRREADEKK